MLDSPLRRLIPLALAAGLLYVSALAFTRLPCWALFPLLVPVAWLIWAYWSGNASFSRRLWLQGVTREDSHVRRWLMRGWLVQALIAVPALAFTALLLATTATLLAPEHWLLLTLDLLLLSLAIGPLQRRLAVDIQPDKAGFIARRWPLLLGNLLFLAIAFLVIDFAVLGGPDTRGQAWHGVAESVFGTAAAGAACTAAGWAVGTLAAMQALAWHASLLVIPSLSEPLLRLGAWLLFLAQAGLFGWLFTAMLLGTLALVEQRRAGRAAAAETSAGATLSTAFIYTILLLAVPYLYAVHKLRTFDPSVLEHQARQVVAWTNPCRADPTLAALSGALDARLQAARVDALATAGARIDAALDTFFARAEQGVDAYLDWYFTVVGGYQRLGAVAAGDFGALMTAELDRHLFEETGFAAWLEDTSAALDTDAEQRLAQLADGLGGQLRRSAAVNDCTVELLAGSGAAGGLGGALDLAGDARRAGMAAAAGATAAGAVTAKLLSKKAVSAVAAKLASTKSFQAAVVLAGKAAAKKGGSSLASALGATALCAPSGPWAVLCGIGAGAVTWLAVDKAMVEIDEVRFREEMRGDLLAALDEQRELVAAALRARQAAAIDAGLGALAEHLGRRYVPARD